MCTSVMTQATQPSGDVGVDSTGLADRIVESTTATLEMFGLYLGNRLGLYQWLWDAGPSTVTELASGAGVDGRYAREWLEQQAVAGFISVDRCDASPHARRYWIPEAHVGALVHDTDPEHVAPLARMVVGIANVLDEVLAAYATGDGVPYEHYGADFRHGQGGINRPAFEHDLASSWISAVEGAATALERGGAVADVGCGQGYSTVAIARAWPQAEVVGVDVDRASVSDARAFAASQDSSARFAELGGEGLAGLGSFDVITMLECLHDMAHPVEALRSAREALTADGVLIIADELVADSFVAPGDELERMMYGWSIVHCLPSARTEPESAGLGTVLRASTVAELVAQAGFSACEVVDVDGGFFRIYAARP